MSVLAAALTVSATTLGGVHHYNRDGRVIVNPPPYPTNRVVSVDNSANGRVWIGRTILGGVERSTPYGWGDPGPAKYGASEHDNTVIYVRVGGHVITAVNPWERIDGTGNLMTLERGRQQWLRENGYTGGVRTFVNPRYGAVDTELTDAGTPGERAVPGRREIQPRGIIELREDIPRRRPRLEVRADEPVVRVTRIAKADG